MMRVPRFLLTAPGSGTGKTMITCGILGALKKRGWNVASFKCGPDYIDPMFHRQVLGIDSYNLDTFLCGREGVRQLLARHGAGKDMAVMEGVMGYYDGIAGISTDASAYDVAQATDTPAVLIVDGKGMSLSVVSVIQGFLHYRADSRIRGVILNRVSPMLYPRLKERIESETGVNVYGYVPVLKDCELKSRYLGLRMPGELREIDRQIRILSEQMEGTVDMDGLIRLAEEASPYDASLQERPVSGTHSLRIGVARDEAFCFLYKDNLELLEELGAELIPFSPVHDEKLPEDLDGLLLYGGYPELYAGELSKNQKMRAAVKEAVDGGLPCIAECGGFLYLKQELADESGERFAMAGVLTGGSYKTPSLRRFGYVTLSGGTVFGQDIGSIPAHEFHYYDSDECGSAFAAKKPMSERSWQCMVSTDTMLAGYPHIHYHGNKRLAGAFLQACRTYREKRDQR